ncbi:hypothetical protein BC940DRAFT_292378 [Gongronella butleri]|nr:hypothetical protein BC940DRAFT_292378 [Gongronella butleri]
MDACFYQAAQKATLGHGDTPKATVYCRWHEQSLDLLSKDTHHLVCTVTVEDNDMRLYSKQVTYRDLKDFTDNNIQRDHLNKLVTAAMQGRRTYENLKIEWKAQPAHKECQLELIVDEANYAMILGSISLDRVDDSKEKDLRREWQVANTQLIASLVEEKEAAAIELANVKDDRDKHMTMNEALVEQKKKSDIEWMAKIKALLNQKKKKIRWMLQQAEFQSIPAIPPSASAADASQPRGKKRSRSSATLGSSSGTFSQTGTLSHTSSGAGRGRGRGAPSSSVPVTMPVASSSSSSKPPRRTASSHTAANGTTAGPSFSSSSSTAINLSTSPRDAPPSSPPHSLASLAHSTKDDPMVIHSTDDDNDGDDDDEDDFDAILDTKQPARKKMANPKHMHKKT